AERPAHELALRADHAAAAEADTALVGRERAREGMDAAARDPLVGGGDAKADEAAVERMRRLFQYRSHVRADGRIDRLPTRTRAREDELEQPQRTRGGNTGADALRGCGESALLASGRRPHDDLHQRVLAGGEVGELPEHEPKRIRPCLAAEREPLRPREHQLTRQHRLGLGARAQAASSSIATVSVAASCAVVMPGQAEASARSTRPGGTAPGTQSRKRVPAWSAAISQASCGWPPTRRAT